MPNIAITGGIASGKSTVIKIFQQLGANSISADTIAKQLTSKGQPTLSEIIKYFGNEFITENGDLDRQKLKAYIFSHPSEKKWLESLLHPLIRTEIERLCHESNAKINIVEIPLLANTKEHYPFIDKIMTCYCDIDTRIERATTRDHISEQKAKEIIQQQPTEAEFTLIADEVIDTNKSIEELSADILRYFDKPCNT